MTTAEPATPSSLRGRTFQGVAWNALGLGGRSVLQIAVLVVLARLISPEDFGIVAAALVVINLTTLLAEVGLGPALVQRPDLRDEHVRAAFTTLLVASLAIWGVVWWQSPWIAGLVGVPQLAGVLPVISSVLWIRNLTVSEYLLARDLAFRRLAIIQLQSYALGYGVVAIGMAVAGAGVWAIVIGHVVGALTNSLLLWWRRRHSVRPGLAWRPLQELLSYGGGHMLARLAGYGAANGDNFVVARWLGAVALGLYGRAYQLMVMPSELFGAVVNRVLFPAMASIQHDQRRLARAYVTGSAVVALATVPVAAVGALTSREIVLVVLGPDWLALQAAFTIMVFGIVLRTGYKISDVVSQATGAVYRRALRQGVYAVLVVGGAMVGSRRGITGVAWATLLALTVNAALMAQLGMALTRTGWRRFLAAHLPGLIVGAMAAVGAAPILFIGRLTGLPAAVILITVALAAATTVLIGCRLGPALAPLDRLTDLVVDVHSMAGPGVARWLERGLGPRYRWGAPGHVEDPTSVSTEV